MDPLQEYEKYLIETSEVGSRILYKNSPKAAMEYLEERSSQIYTLKKDEKIQKYILNKKYLDLEYKIFKIKIEANKKLMSPLNN